MKKRFSEYNTRENQVYSSSSSSENELQDFDDLIFMWVPRLGLSKNESVLYPYYKKGGDQRIFFVNIPKWAIKFKESKSRKWTIIF